jgi:hypothetical protein
MAGTQADAELLYAAGPAAAQGFIHCIVYLAAGIAYFEVFIITRYGFEIGVEKVFSYLSLCFG